MSILNVLKLIFKTTQWIDHRIKTQQSGRGLQKNLQ